MAREPVVIAAYDANWESVFRQIRALVQSALGDLIIAVEHVGSTAVPGLAAKPIIDVDVIIPSPADLPLAIERLATIGYQHRGDLDVPGREAFDAPPGSPRQHLYVCALGNRELIRHLVFRDHLRASPRAVQQYEELKRELADRYRDNREDYTNGKAAFVEEILDLALAAGKLDLQLLRPDLLSPIAKAEIRSLDRHTVWGGDGRVAEWAPEREAVVVGRLEGRLATYVGIVLREILVDGQPTRVAGIASVMTEPELQGRGFATAALKLAVGHMQSVEAEFALLTALEHRRTFYERLGWRVVANSVVCDQANGKVHLNDPGRHEMVLPLRGDLVGDGRIDLCGLPW